jgi:hypothetical protein
MMKDFEISVTRRGKKYAGIYPCPEGTLEAIQKYGDDYVFKAFVEKWTRDRQQDLLVDSRAKKVRYLRLDLRKLSASELDSLKRSGLMKGKLVKEEKPDESSINDAVVPDVPQLGVKFRKRKG